MLIRQITVNNSYIPDLQTFSDSHRYFVHQTSAWIKAFLGSDRDNLFLAVYTPEKKFVGVLTLSIQYVRGTRFWKFRRFIPVANGPSDFYYILSLPGYEDDVTFSLALWFKLNLKMWDYLYLNNIPVTSKTWKLFLQQMTDLGFAPIIEQSKSFYKIDTTQSWEEYESKFLHKKLADLRNRQNRLKRDQIKLNIKFYHQNINQWLDTFFNLYHKRRLVTQQNSAVDDPNMYNRLRQVISDYEKQGLVRFSILEDELGNHWAYQLDWVHNHIWYHYMPTFDDRFKDYSPGKLLLYEVIKHCFHDPEIVEFNFMRGLSPYKTQFSDQSEGYVSIKVENHRSLRLRIKRMAAWVVKIRQNVSGR